MMKKHKLDNLWLEKITRQGKRNLEAVLEGGYSLTKGILNMHSQHEIGGAVGSDSWARWHWRGSLIP